MPLPRRNECAVKYRPHGMLALTDALHNYVPLATRAVISVTRSSINAFPLLSFSQCLSFSLSLSLPLCFSLSLTLLLFLRASASTFHPLPPLYRAQSSHRGRERQVDMGGKRMRYESVRKGAREALTLTRLLVK